MRKVELLTALPGCCYLCRSSNRGWYIDTEQSIDMFGAVAICNECIMLMAREANMLTPAEFQGLQDELETSNNEVFDLRVQVTGLEQAIDGLRFAGSVVRTDPEPNLAIPISGNDEGQQGAEADLGDGAGEVAESFNDPRMAKLSDDADSKPEPFSFNI